MSNKSTVNANQNGDYYNDTYSGIGWINAIRVHQSPGKPPFMALDLHVKQGPKQPKDGARVKTLRLNTIIRGLAASRIASDLIESIDFSQSARSEANPDGRPVISARFVTGSLELDSYVQRESGDVIPTLHAALLDLTHVYVDGVRIDVDPDIGDQDRNSSSIQPVPVAPSNDFVGNTEAQDYAPINQWIEASLELDVIRLNRNDPTLGLKILYLQESGYATNDSLTWTIPDQAIA